MCCNVFTTKINLFWYKRFKDGRCTYKNTGSSHLKSWRLTRFDKLNRITINKQKVRLRPTEIRRPTFYHSSTFSYQRQEFFAINETSNTELTNARLHRHLTRPCPPTRKENMHRPNGTKTTKASVKGLNVFLCPALVTWRLWHLRPLC